jgi:hypothetical protein
VAGVPPILLTCEVLHTFAGEPGHPVPAATALEGLRSHRRGPWRLSVAEVERAIGAIGQAIPVRAAARAAYAPQFGAP